MAPSILSHKDERDSMAPSILPHKEEQARLAPSILSHKEAQDRMAPSILSHKEAQDRMAPSILSHKEAQDRMAPSILSHKEAQDRMAPSILSHKEGQGRMAPSIPSHKEGQGHMAPSILSLKEGQGRMAQSILSHLERQGRRILLETSRSCASNKSAKTTSARSSSRDRKQKGIKRVSFYGLGPCSNNKDDTLTTRGHAATQAMQLNTLRPLCRKMCLVTKKTVTTSDLTVNSPLRQTSGKSNLNLNMKLTNVAQLNVTDSSNVTRHNEKESSRNQIRRPPERSMPKQSQPNSKSKVSLAGIYWHMSKPGPCQVRPRRHPQKVANIHEKPAGKLQLNKTHTNTHRLQKCPESKSGNNSLVARTNLDGLAQKKSITRRKAKLPTSVCSSKRAEKTKISNKIRKGSELSAFAGNETPPNHTEDFQQYIQLTRSDLHPFDAQRIRQDGSSVDPAVSHRRTSLQNGRVVNMATGHVIESTPAINSPAKEAHSSIKIRLSHKRRKPKKPRSPRTLKSRQKTGNVGEKSPHVEENLSKEGEDRLKAASVQHGHVTDETSGLTAAKQIQYKLALANLQTFRKRTHPKPVDPPKTTSLESRLQSMIHIVQSSTARSPVLSNVALSCMQRSVSHKMPSSRLNDETNEQAVAEAVAEVTAKQIAPGDHSGDCYCANEYPNMAAERRHAAYMAYAKTGRRAELLGDVIEVVEYDKNNPMLCTGDAKSGFSQEVSAHKRKSVTAKNSAEIDFKKTVKPKLRKMGRLKRRRSKSAVTARSKKQDRGGPVINVTENSSTRKMSTQPRSGISRRPRPRRRRKSVHCRENRPATSGKCRSRDATSHRSPRPNKSKYRKKSTTVPGRVSHTAKRTDSRTAKCPPINKSRRTKQHSDSSHNKSQATTFVFKRCDCLSKPPKVKMPRRKRSKLKRFKRCRRTNKQTKYFNRNNQRKNITEDMYRMKLPETYRAEGQIRAFGDTNPESMMNRLLSTNIYLNTIANGEEEGFLSDDSGGLSGTPRISTMNVSRPALLTESNSLFKLWENL